MKTQKSNLKIAHRGMWNEEIPENSLGAFQRCVDNGVPIELDVHLLKDGNLAVFHDDNLLRMTGYDVKIKDLDCQELAKYDLLQTNHKIPLLEEVLELVNGKVLLDIELKCDVKSFKICRELVKLLDVYKGDFLVKSFNPIYIIWFRLFRPEYDRGVLVSKLKNAKIPKVAKWFLSRMYFNLLAKPDFIAFNKEDLPSKRLDKFHKKGVTVLLWTIMDDKIEYDYDGIIFEEST